MMPGVRIIGEAQPLRNPDKPHLFAGRVAAACERTEERVASGIARDAARIYAGSGMGWDITFISEGNEAHAIGPFAEMAEFGSPPHAIVGSPWLGSPKDPGVVERGGPWKRVNHPGTEEIAMIRSAGDDAYSTGLGIFIEELP